MACISSGIAEPIDSAPCLGVADAGGKRRHLVQPQVGQAQCLDDGAALGVEDRRIAFLGDRVPGDVFREVPVEWAAASGLVGQHVGELVQHGSEVLHVARAERVLLSGLVLVSRLTRAVETEGDVAHGLYLGQDEWVTTFTLSGRSRGACDRRARST
jgi:hypothetical protein